MRGVRKVIVPELNLGQYRLEVERLAHDGVDSSRDQPGGW